MKLCNRCLNPATRPNMDLDTEGICPVCRFTERNKNNKIDWEERRKELKEITDWGRKNSKTSYDCIVTVSGGKDSMKQAFFARDELGLNVLLVSSVYPPEHQHDRGARNLSNLVAHGFDTATLSLNPISWKEMMRQSFFKHANWCKSTEMALYAIPIHVAIAYKIPLIFLGENPTYTIGENLGGGKGGDASKMKYSNTLSGGIPHDLMSDKVSMKDVHFYTYPSEDDVEAGQLRIIYLGYYIKEWSGFNNAQFAKERGLEVRDETPEQIGDLWGFTALDEEFYVLNQMIKYVKFGFGQVADQVCEAINRGSMTKEEGFELMKLYDGNCDKKYIDHFCRYLGISQKEFWDVVESYRNPVIWNKNEKEEWVLDYEDPFENKPEEKI